MLNILQSLELAFPQGAELSQQTISKKVLVSEKCHFLPQLVKCHKLFFINIYYSPHHLKTSIKLF